MYTSTPILAVEPFLVVVAQGCMQKVCKGGGGGANLGFSKGVGVKGGRTPEVKTPPLTPTLN